MGLEVMVSKQRKFAGRALRVAAVSGIVLGTLAPTAAFAAPYPNGGDPPSEVDPGSQVQNNAATNSGSLPFTGGDAAGLAIIGIGAVAAGTVIVRQSRRRVAA